MCMILPSHTWMHALISFHCWSIITKISCHTVPLPHTHALIFYRIIILLASGLNYQIMNMNTLMKPWNAFLSKLVSCNRLASTILQPLADTSSDSSAPPSALALPPNIASFTSVFSVVS